VLYSCMVGQSSSHQGAAPRGAVPSSVVDIKLNGSSVQLYRTNTISGTIVPDHYWKTPSA
jgi:hypothetical protein